MPTPPLENCPDVEDCLSDPSEIGRVCTYGPICGTCAVYRVIESARGLLLGTCRIRTDRGEFPCTAPICEAYSPRAGAPPARIVQIAKGPVPRSLRDARAVPRPPPSPPQAQKPIVRQPDVPIEELSMTREELKAIIREAMEEDVRELPLLAPKWEGGVALLKPGDPTLQAKEVPLPAFFHKVVMIRDRLRVLEQKINGNPRLTDAEKVDLQGYITGCYGSLTTFNVLFRERDDGFRGSGGKE
jgi:hypothetical protein